MKQLPEAHSVGERNIVADVTTYGWHVMHVMADSTGPGWSFSIGLFHTFGHPELLVFGLPSNIAQPIINDLGSRIRSGAAFAHGVTDSDVLQHHAVHFVTVPPSAFGSHLGYAVWFYGQHQFPSLQIVWPDRTGLFPWQRGFDVSLHALQPVLGAAT
jgi:hypothetical protein